MMRPVTTHASRWQLYETTEITIAPGWQLDTIVPPARHFPTNGIRVAPDGRLWITQTRGRHVTALGLSTNEQQIVVPLGAGLHGPDDLAFDRDGNTFFTEPHDDRVMRLTRDGVVEVWVEDLPSANGIAMSNDGRLFIDECRPGGRVMELDLRTPGASREVIGDLALPNAFDVGPDGWLYLPEVAANRILAVHPDRGESRVAVDDVWAPSAVKFDHAGRLVTTEAGSGRVTRVDLGTGERTTLAQLFPGLDNFAFAGEDTVYVSSFVTGAIVRLDLGRGSTEFLTPPGLVAVNAISRTRDARWLVSDRTSVAEVDPSGGFRRVASVPVDMNFTVAAAADAGGSLCALTTDSRLLQRPAGTSEFRSWTLSTPHESARCLAGADDFVLVGAGAEVLIVDETGHVVRSITTATTVTATAGCGEAVVACDRSRGTIALHDNGRPRVWRDFVDPVAVALSSDAVFVAEEAPRRVIRVDRASGERTVVASDMPFGSPVAGHANGAGPPSLCADRDGSLIVGCSGDASIRRLFRSTNRIEA